MPVEIVTLAQMQRVAVMLGLDPLALREGDAVPRGWHFSLLTGQTPRCALRSDGFPGLGVAMPQLDLPRLLLGGRSTTFHGELTVGTPLQRNSAIASIDHKTGRNGPFAIVKVSHILTTDSGEVTETQTYVLAGPPSQASERPAPPPLPQGRAKVVTPDDLMLFQYSALGFNTHRIHFDRHYARTEGHPDLVVNGGLATLLATEFLRLDLGCKLRSIAARHVAPLYVNRPLTICVPDLTEAPAKALLLDSEGGLAAELVITLDDL